MRDLRLPASDGPVDRAAFCLLIREISSGERAMGELPCLSLGVAPRGFRVIGPQLMSFQLKPVTYTILRITADYSFNLEIFPDWVRNNCRNNFSGI
jgi:hypothetical protein